MSLDVYLETPPCEHCGSPGATIFDANITHNLVAMAKAAGIYQHLWRPEEIEISNASQLIEPLRAGLEWLRNNESAARKHSPESGWGTYEGFVPWVEQYLAACEAHPRATVRVSR